MGSPPQIETMGAPHSSAAATHCSTLIISLIVLLYSRMRPQPVQVRLQACSGSSIMTRGNFFSPRSFFPAMYFVKFAVIFNGNLIKPPEIRCEGGTRRVQTGASDIPQDPAFRYGTAPVRKAERNFDTSGISSRTHRESRCL